MCEGCCAVVARGRTGTVSEGAAEATEVLMTVVTGSETIAEAEVAVIEVEVKAIWVDDRWKGGRRRGALSTASVHEQHQRRAQMIRTTDDDDETGTPQPGGFRPPCSSL